MTAYVITEIKVSDPEQYKGYQALSPGAVAAAGGEFLVRGGRTEVLEGPIASAVHFNLASASWNNSLSPTCCPLGPRNIVLNVGSRSIHLRESGSNTSTST